MTSALLTKGCSQPALGWFARMSCDLGQVYLVWQRKAQSVPKLCSCGALQHCADGNAGPGPLKHNAVSGRGCTLSSKPCLFPRLISFLVALFSFELAAGASMIHALVWHEDTLWQYSLSRNGKIKYKHLWNTVNCLQVMNIAYIILI